MRNKCQSIATFHRPIHSHWSLPLSTWLESLTYSDNVLGTRIEKKYLCSTVFVFDFEQYTLKETSRLKGMKRYLVDHVYGWENDLLDFLDLVVTWPPQLRPTSLTDGIFFSRNVCHFVCSPLFLLSRHTSKKKLLKTLGPRAVNKYIYDIL